MADARAIYQLHADEYDALVGCEDRDGRLPAALREIGALDGARVVELGAGTGRVTLLVAPLAASIVAFDAAAPMLAVARRKLAGRRVALAVADNARLPVASGRADVAIAGWTYGHQTVWNARRWRNAVEAAIGEMLRVVRPGGTAIVIETLGTGHDTPFEPPRELGRYYSLLERELGFERRWIRTDYEFPSVAEGARLVRFFFGDELADAFAARGEVVLPECTGIWWRRR